MTGQQIIDIFRLLLDDTSELSTTEELALANRIYKKICIKPYEFLKKEATGTLSDTLPYISLPTDFLYIPDSFDGDSPKNIYVSGSPIQIGSFSERHNGSGTSVALLDHYNNVDAKSFIIGGWSESAALYDIDAYGSPTIINFTLASSAATAHLRTTTGNVQLIGCRFQNLNNASVVFGSGGNVSWYGTTLDSQGYFFSGCGFSNANVTAFGSTGSIQSKYISSDNSAGISTTVTTASLVGKTITIKDGIITAFA